MAFRRAVRTALTLVAGGACALASHASETGCRLQDGATCAAQGNHVLLQILEQDRLKSSMTKTGMNRSRFTTKHRRMWSLAKRSNRRKRQVHASPAAATGSPRVTVSGRQILVDSKPLHIKGVCWSPVHQGDDNKPDYHNYVKQDEELMKSAGINAVRTYDADILFDREALDALQAAGIWLVPTVYGYGESDPASVIEKVNAAKDHPVVLMWAIGNEWNYNGIYVDMAHHEALARLNIVAAHIKKTDPSRPVATVYGGLPSVETVNAMPDIDVWGMNVYSGISFGSVLETWAAVSGKPLYLGEYGADAYNALRQSEDDDSQAMATEVLSAEILGHSAVFGGVCSGGFLFEFSDEWWKDQQGTASVHDVGGVAPGGGPFPDLTFNEEWWGIVDVDRNPRPAYYAYAEVANPSQAAGP